MMNRNTLYSWTFIGVLTAVTIGFFAILQPFYSAIFWAATLTVLFWPIHKRILKKVNGRKNLAAMLTLLTCTLIVIIPLALASVSVVQELLAFYGRMNNEGNSFEGYLQQISDATPEWAWEWLRHFGIDGIAEVQQKLSSVATQALSFVYGQAVSLGQDTMRFFISFVLMMYMLFFFFRDGSMIMSYILHAVPIERDYLGTFGSKFTAVVKATIKGNLVVAAVQGLLGGLMFWATGIQGPMLWGVVMAFLSLLPAVGASLVWGPVAIYLIATGAVLKGIVIIAIGAGVIGLVDNILRPILVGKSTKMPDYLILLSTLGGLSLFGITGFVAGPVIAALFIAIWALFANIKEEDGLVQKKSLPPTRQEIQSNQEPK